MKVLFNSEKKSVLRFDPGDEVVAFLEDLARERSVSFLFSMIGGCGEVSVAYVDATTSEYVSKTFTAPNIEVIHVSGNVGWFEDSPTVHVHGVFGHDDYSTFGGHVMKMVISLNGEAVIDWLPVKIEKKINPKNGLKLFCDR